MKSGANSVASYSYDYVGNRDVTTLGNGTSTEYDYDTDPRYRLDTITHKKGANTLATIGYTATARDNAGNPKSMTDWTGTWDYGYDDNNRLITATPPNPVPDQPAGGDYGYDWVGNRLNPPTGSNHMVYNKADQLVRWPGMHGADSTTYAGYTYYGDGSLHEVKDASGTNVLRSYTYTPDGLLDEATYNSRTLSNTWDGSKNRVSFTAGSTTHTFVYDTTAGIPAVIQEDSVYYIREPGGLLIARISGANTSYYHFDALGSTRLLTDSDGDVTDKYAYDAYGSLISHDEYTGSVDQPYQHVGQLGYYTHWQEPDFGLVLLGERFYDSEIGRFTQRDPIERLNLYYYADCRPLLLTDALGLAPKFLGCTANQEKELKKHINDILSNRLTCISGGKALASCIESRLRDGYIRCGNRPGEPPCTGCGYADYPHPRKHIHVCTDAFKSAKCGCLGRTIIHEFGHSCDKRTGPPPGGGDPPIGYQCEQDCYGKGKPACPK